MNASTRLGVVNPETWDFLRDLFEFFRSRYETNEFKPVAARLPLFRSRAERYLLGRDMGRFLRSNDAVFFEWASNMLALATSLPRASAIVTRLHRWELYKWSHLVNWDAVDRVILVSEAKRKEFLERFPAQKRKVHVIPESIDVDRFPFAEREFSGSIGILCHVSPRKRVYELILAFSELLRSRRSLRLYVGGDPHPAHGDYWSALQSLVLRLGLEDAVTFDGFVSSPPEWYRKIDIFVSNSYSEGLQVSPMEAMASGCYTLAHRWEGAEELLPEDCLYFTERELLDKIRRYCALPAGAREEQRARMRSIAATRFNIAVNAPRIAALIDDAISS